MVVVCLFVRSNWWLTVCNGMQWYWYGYGYGDGYGDGYGYGYMVMEVEEMGWNGMGWGFTYRHNKQSIAGLGFKKNYVLSCTVVMSSCSMVRCLGGK